MKNISSKVFLALIILGVASASAGIWTGFLSGYLKATNDSKQAQQLFASPAPIVIKSSLSPALEPLVQGVPKRGQNFAIMRIPALGPYWVRTISEGTTPQILDRLGTGHYEGTEFPGEPGNFAIAGHSGNRWTPFARYQKITNGELIEVETFDRKFTYQVIETVTVAETNLKTVYENPSLKLETDGKSWLTITTCVTEGPDDVRIAIFAKLVSGVAKE
jgi:sortase A